MADGHGGKAADSGGVAPGGRRDAAKAAGAAPIRRGRPGCRDALGRDKDGIACDK
ncbi:excalibur calcium-binding domain-containing protein [Streptomyces sp. NPDC127110]|uniref:excalibur calcium-binding domain-containing protein n=1 Tax=Streptomyces sp. NPDC127110 TaxID=3345362 RepID=UPI003638C5FE